MHLFKPAKVRSIAQKKAAGRAAYWLGWLGLAVLVGDRLARGGRAATRWAGGFLLGWLALSALVGGAAANGTIRWIRAVGSRGRFAWTAGKHECALLASGGRRAWAVCRKLVRRVRFPLSALARACAKVVALAGWLGLWPVATSTVALELEAPKRGGTRNSKKRRGRRRGRAERGARERNRLNWGQAKHTGEGAATWMGARRSRGGWRVAGGWLTGACALAGTGVLLGALALTPPRPPQPVPQAMPSPHAQGPHTGLARAVPARIEIPVIGVDAGLLSLGLDDKEELAVPPLDRAELASWYNLGPSPGEPGSAVIVGHVDSAKIGPAVFFNLGKLKPGDVIKVAREDGTTPTFKVDSVQMYLKTSFPTQLVYAGERATLRVITCGGEFDKKSRNYLSNVVVFASLET